MLAGIGLLIVISLTCCILPVMVMGWAIKYSWFNDLGEVFSILAIYLVVSIVSNILAMPLIQWIVNQMC